MKEVTETRLRIATHSRIEIVSSFEEGDDGEQFINKLVESWNEIKKNTPNFACSVIEENDDAESDFDALWSIQFYRWETDEEYRARCVINRHNAKHLRDEEIEKQKAERALYETLKKKYGNR